MEDVSTQPREESKPKNSIFKLDTIEELEELEELKETKLNQRNSLVEDWVEEHVRQLRNHPNYAEMVFSVMTDTGEKKTVKSSEELKPVSTIGILEVLELKRFSTLDQAVQRVNVIRQMILHHGKPEKVWKDLGDRKAEPDKSYLLLVRATQACFYKSEMNFLARGIRPSTTSELEGFKP
jgi:hypothetical protein